MAKRNDVLCVRSMMWIWQFLNGKVCCCFSLLLFSKEKEFVFGIWISRLLLRSPSLCYSSKRKQSCKACFPKTNYWSKKGSTTEFQSREKSYNRGEDLAIFRYMNSTTLLISVGSTLIFQVLRPKKNQNKKPNQIFFTIIRCEIINIHAIQTDTLDIKFIFFPEYFSDFNNLGSVCKWQYFTVA